MYRPRSRATLPRSPTFPKNNTNEPAQRYKRALSWDGRSDKFFGMRTSELDYQLPAGLIAQQPSRARSASRLLVFSRAGGEIIDTRFGRIGEFLRRGDCLVLNDTKVLPARFYARRLTGGKLEGLFQEQTQMGVWEVLLKGAGKVRLDERIMLKDIHGGDFCDATVEQKKADGKCILKVQGDASRLLEKIGFPPLPPYIKRDADIHQARKDRTRYQTVYANKDGAIAAPTAGLHFTKNLIGQLKKQGVLFAYTTLHVGEGTFKPVSAQTLEEHEIHQEWFSIDEVNAAVVNEARRKGGRIIAVGTTSVRALESAAAGSQVQPMAGSTRLFITPGYKFKVVDAMVTNFHLPKSTLLALVAAFAGLERIMAVYRYAIDKRYRFYSYGDAMLIV